MEPPKVKKYTRKIGVHTYKAEHHLDNLDETVAVVFMIIIIILMVRSQKEELVLASLCGLNRSFCISRAFTALKSAGTWKRIKETGKAKGNDPIQFPRETKKKGREPGEKKGGGRCWD